MVGEEAQGTEDFSNNETSLYDTVMVDICHYTVVQTHGMHSTELRPPVILMCHCRFIDCNKCSTLVGVLVVGSYACVGQGVYGKTLYLTLSAKLILL